MEVRDISSYEMQEKVGEGTFGEVHKAKDSKTQHFVALKRILLHTEKDGIPITALREIKFLRRMQHRNVIGLLAMAVEYSPEGNQMFMVFPYMEHDLTGLLTCPSVKLSLPQIKCYAKQLFEGLAYMHERNLFHRDIKSSNLLINNEGVLKIADFGLARPIDLYHGDYTPGVVTRWYRPPEILLGHRKYTEAVDLWGTGCILAEMFTRKPIMAGGTDFNQIELLVDLCGHIDETSLPGCSSFPDFHTLHFGKKQRKIKDRFKGIDSHALDLIDKLLQLDASKRPTAKQCLKHKFFTADPLPTKEQDMPKYSSVHELDSRKAKTGSKLETSEQKSTSARKSNYETHRQKISLKVESLQADPSLIEVKKQLEVRQLAKYDVYERQTPSKSEWEDSAKTDDNRSDYSGKSSLSRNESSNTLQNNRDCSWVRSERTEYRSTNNRYSNRNNDRDFDRHDYSYRKPRQERYSTGSSREEYHDRRDFKRDESSRYEMRQSYQPRRDTYIPHYAKNQSPSETRKKDMNMQDSHTNANTDQIALKEKDSVELKPVQPIEKIETNDLEEGEQPE